MWSKDLPASSVTAGQMNHLLQYAGNPAAGSFSGVAKTATAITGGDSPSMTSGIITLNSPLSNEQSLLNYIDAFSIVTNQNGILIVGDLLAYYPSLDSNTAGAQAMLGTPSTGDSIYTRAYQDYEGVMIFADVQVALGAGAANLTVTYTDQDGLTGTTSSLAMLVSSPLGKIPYSYNNNSPFLRLASGARGVKSIQSFTLSAGMGAGGTFALCLFKPLLTIPVIQNVVVNYNHGMWEGIANLEAVLLGTNPALSMIWLPGATVVGTLSGIIKSLNVRSL